MVFVGRVPGIYNDWKDCEKQVSKFPSNKQRGYDTRAEAEEVWETHQRELAKELQHIPDYAPTLQIIDANSSRPGKRARALESDVFVGGLGKPVCNVTDIFDDGDGNGNEDQLPRKKPKMTADFFAECELDFIRFDGDESEGVKLASGEELVLGGQPDLREQKEEITLTAAQQGVVELAVAGHNIFLTGAAGSGKTATLKEILNRLRTMYEESECPKYPAVQVVAPTGISALPLNGRTTYSFAGWYEKYTCRFG